MSSEAIARRDLEIESAPGIRLAVRHVAAADTPSTKIPVILLHGARVPGIPSFDLDCPDGSLAADLARAGHDVFIMDARGYGGSTRIGQEGDPAEAQILSPSNEVRF
jgi:alpha-beta hydrolase superfamily lysophospholipase